MKDFRTHAEFLRHRARLGRISFLFASGRFLSKVPILKISKLKVIQMTIKQYKSPILTKQPGHRKSSTSNEEPAAFTLKAPIIYKNSIQKLKAKLVSPKLKQPMLLLFFYKIYPRPGVEECCFPHSDPNSWHQS